MDEDENIEKTIDMILEEQGMPEPSDLLTREVQENQARDEIREMLQFREESESIQNAIKVLAEVGPQIHGVQYMESMFEELHGVGERMREFADRIANEPHNMVDIIGISYETLEAILQIAKDQYKENRMEQAEDLFFLLATFCPLNAGFWFSHASSRQNQGKFSQARKSYMIAAEVDTKDPLPFLYIAECCLSEGMKEEANEWKEKGQERLSRLEDKADFEELFIDFNAIVESAA